MSSPASCCHPSPPDLSGSWRGNWSSNQTGHQGPLRAKFRPLADGRYKVTFCGRFFKIMPFRYTIVLSVTRYENGRAYLSGSKNLGLWFGTFSFNAWASDSQFVATYRSKKDQGQFTMCRTGR